MQPEPPSRKGAQNVRIYEVPEDVEVPLHVCGLDGPFPIVSCKPAAESREIIRAELLDFLRERFNVCHCSRSVYAFFTHDESPTVR